MFEKSDKRVIKYKKSSFYKQIENNIASTSKTPSPRDLVIDLEAVPFDACY